VKRGQALDRPAEYRGSPASGRAAPIRARPPRGRGGWQAHSRELRRSGRNAPRILRLVERRV